ncbi:glutaminyl-tRNA synthase (glutamine-hydrolyzing) subunit A [Candidatus Nomurabacteria bacterium RIFOXYC2_FULL_36_8]|nr:MAG: Glutamyl-tRNA(Gln) amidotransferase subunit A [Candidatus Nomurabacteria bacterium GW2011_GWE2_36_115]KKP94483.1 MAG: Glutamyl-tRNA(Gln) amidotransferase subunit A [Candidatus Nomurabacteria bacterium GW2011_GWF2_36_126]KKP96945.1 MAG: Glutamyl-tRNA(Gln) amidotransferase subunit A [Candidatus Nomurabacteria bacterium GW2011_GWD2_36_14]KKP99451.1 MAG: Glutamyl-tRNA(Gln) amidotransferase subunit A [Candidatus Nomurabacteria bacterium GW2011_GWF2_36_19]KKQ05693.1 MAG: Glutamyl-tRNA(Gln) am
MIDLKNLTIEKTNNHYKNGDFTVRELVDEYLKVIKNNNERINAYLEIYNDIDVQIKKAEEMFKNGTATVLTGIPFSLKDNILLEGHVASASSKILENHVATYDSFVVKKLKEQGVIFLGRTNMDEFAMGSSTQTSAFGITRNPLDESLVPGGSSGGPAASVAGDMALVALGTETCGSIRQPAAFCGLVGLKPTYGMVSRSGVISLGSSLDQVSPLGRTVRDTEIIFNTISSHDAKDSTSIPDNMRIIKNNIIKKKIGIPRKFLSGEGIDKEVMKNFEESCDKLQKAGYELIDVDLPSIKYSLAVYHVLMQAEASSNLARFDGIRYGKQVDGEKLYDVYAKSRGRGFGKETRRRVLLGTYILSHGYYDAYYNSALKVRQMIKDELTNFFKDFDTFMTPTVPFLPFKIGEKLDDPIGMYLSDLFSAPANLADIPSIAIPSGKSEGGLPFSIQFTSPYLREDILFTIGKDFEKLV